MAARILVVTSGKGGVGKTTSTAALGAALASAGRKVAVGGVYETADGWGPELVGRPAQIRCKDGALEVTALD